MILSKDESTLIILCYNNELRTSIQIYKYNNNIKRYEKMQVLDISYDSVKISDDSNLLLVFTNTIQIYEFKEVYRLKIVHLNIQIDEYMISSDFKRIIIINVHKNKLSII